MKMFLRMGILISVSSALLACATKDVDVKNDSQNIKMGVILPLTGKRAEYAHYVRRGMEIAQEEINSATNPSKFAGNKVELRYADTKGDSGETSACIDSLTREGVSVIHAGFTNDIAYDLNTFGQLKNALVNFISEYPPAAVHNDNAIRIYLNGAQVCELMAKAAPESAKVDEKKLVIVSVDDAEGKSCGDYLRFQTGSSKFKIFSEVYRDGEMHFDVFAENIANLNPEYVMLYGYGDASEPFLKSLKKYGFKGVFISNEGLCAGKLKHSEDIDVYEVVSAFSQGTLQNETSENFRTIYEKKYGTRPHWAAAFGYDSVMYTARAMNESNGDVKKARQWFSDKTLQGAAGEIKFDKLGDTTSQVELIKR